MSAVPGRLPQGSAELWPRVARSLEIILQADGVIIDGGPHRVMLRSARSASLNQLVSLLDGQHSPQSVCQQAGVTQRQLDHVIGTLRDEGVLELAPPEAVRWPVPDHVVGYLARAGRATAEYSCVEELLTALAETVVLLVAAPRWTRCLAADLTEAGIGQLVVRERVSAVTEADLAASADARSAVVVVWDNPENPAAFDDLMARCAGRPVPVLRFAAGPAGAEIGPLFFDGHAACAACFRRGQCGRTWAGLALDTAAGCSGAVYDGAAASLAGSLAVTEILAVATRLTRPLVPGRMLRLTYGDLKITAVDVSPDADCLLCGGPPDDAAALVEMYEYSMALRPAKLAWPAAETPAHQELLASLQSQRASYPWAPRYQLPAAGVPLADPQAEPGDRSPAARIGSLMQAVAGTRAAADDGTWPSPEVSAFRSRWVPTGGNLASVELFAITGSQVFDLPGSVFKYDDLEHAVVSVRRDAVILRELIAATDLPEERVDLLLVFVAALGRLQKKYGEFCLRLAHLDAGCAAVQLAVAAPAMGLETAFAASWTPEVASELELDSETELVTAIAGITIQGGRQWT